MHETTIRRKHDKTLVAETDVHLEGKRWLSLYTTKDSRGGIYCRASVATRNGDGTVTHVLGFGTPGGDFSRVVEYEPGVRCTEKVLRAVHQRAVDRLGDILAAARAHYRLPEAASLEARP